MSLADFLHADTVNILFLKIKRVFKKKFLCFFLFFLFIIFKVNCFHSLIEFDFSNFQFIQQIDQGVHKD